MSCRRSITAQVTRFITLTIVSVTAAASLHAAGYPQPSQDQTNSGAHSQQSIAEAARRARQQSKNATKPSRVITDDDLDKKNVKPGQQGLTVDAPAKLETQPPTPGAVAEAQVDDSQSKDAATAPSASDDAEIKKLKEQIAEAEKDVDLLKRDLALKQDTYYSNPDYLHNTAGKAVIDAQQQEIATQQENIGRLKIRLAALEETARTQPSKNSKTKTSVPSVPPQR
jgi:hypothetical protein